MFSAIKLSVLLSILFALQGCAWQVVDQFDIYKASIICGSVDNIVEIEVQAIGIEKVLCKNNKIYPL